MNSILSINPSDPNPIIAQVPSVIAGFWKRLFAAVIDSILVGAVGFIFGIIFFDALMEMGEWGRLLGFAISLPYFYILNSSLGNGQTVGKRLLGVRVVNGSCGLISPTRAAVRYGVLGLPFILGGISLSGSRVVHVINTGIDVIVGLALFAIATCTF